MNIDRFVPRVTTSRTWNDEEFWRMLDTLSRRQGAHLERHSVVRDGDVFGYVMALELVSGVENGERVVNCTATGKPRVNMAGVRKILGGPAKDDVLARLTEIYRKTTGSELSCEEGLKFRCEGSEPDVCSQVMSVWKRFTSRVFSPVIQVGMVNSVRGMSETWSGVWTFDGVAIHAVTVESAGEAESLYDRVEFHVVRGRQKLGGAPGELE